MFRIRETMSDLKSIKMESLLRFLLLVISRDKERQQEYKRNYTWNISISAG